MCAERMTRELRLLISHGSFGTATSAGRTNIRLREYLLVENAAVGLLILEVDATLRVLQLLWLASMKLRLGGLSGDAKQHFHCSIGRFQDRRDCGGRYHR